MKIKLSICHVLEMCIREKVTDPKQQICIQLQALTTTANVLLAQTRYSPSPVTRTKSVK